MRPALLPVLLAGLCECFLLANVDAKKVLAARLAGCAVLDVVYPVGTSWTERCRRCTCTSSGESCTTPACSYLPYKPEHDHQCAEWESSCCCKATGCKVSSGAIVPLNNPLPKDPARPCEQCNCAGGDKKKDCTVQFCPSPACAKPVPVPGQCCPECPTGCTLSNGTVIPLGSPLPINPNEPCKVCRCGDSNCGIIICKKPNCWPLEKPRGVCCEQCAAKCPLPTAVVNNLSAAETKPHEVGWPQWFQSVNPNEFFSCSCSGPGQTASCATISNRK